MRMLQPRLFGCVSFWASCPHRTTTFARSGHPNFAHALQVPTSSGRGTSPRDLLSSATCEAALPTSTRFARCRHLRLPEVAVPRLPGQSSFVHLKRRWELPNTTTPCRARRNSTWLSITLRDSRMGAQTHTHSQTHASTLLHLRLHAPIHTHGHGHAHAHVHTHTHTRTRTHTQPHAHAHART